MLRVLVLAAAVLAGVSSTAATGSAARLAACAPSGETKTHDEAVFGHFSTLAQAKAFAKQPSALGFQGIKIEDDGCGDFEVEIDGADTERDRSSFAAEAAKSGYWITFEQLGDMGYGCYNFAVGRG